MIDDVLVKRCVANVTLFQDSGLLMWEHCLVHERNEILLVSVTNGSGIKQFSDI